MRSTGKQSIAMPRIALQPLFVRKCLKGQEVTERRASHAFFAKNNGSNKMNVSEWAGRTKFSDFSLGKMDRLGKAFRSSCKTSSNQSKKKDEKSQCELLAPLNKNWTKRNSDHRLNSPPLNLLVGVFFFRPTKLEKTYMQKQSSSN